jgi:hypothetical protein
MFGGVCAHSSDKCSQVNAQRRPVNLALNPRCAWLTNLPALALRRAQVGNQPPWQPSLTLTEGTDRKEATRALTRRPPLKSLAAGRKLAQAEERREQSDRGRQRGLAWGIGIPADLFDGYWCANIGVVVASAQVLHEGVSRGEYPCRVVALQASHRPQPWFQPSVVRLDWVVRVPLDGVQGRGRQLIEDPRVGGRAFGRDLGGDRARVQSPGEETPGSRQARRGDSSAELRKLPRGSSRSSRARRRSSGC